MDDVMDEFRCPKAATPEYHDGFAHGALSMYCTVKKLAEDKTGKALELFFLEVTKRYKEVQNGKSILA